MLRAAPEIVKVISDMDCTKFMEFIRYNLEISGRKIEDAKIYGDVGEDLKYDHIQESYKKDPQYIVQRFGPLLETTLQNVQPGTPIPDRLPSKVVYRIIDDQKSTRNSWLRFARETLGVNVDRFTIALANRVISKQQKHSLLQSWIEDAENEFPNPLDEMERRYTDFIAHRAF